MYELINVKGNSYFIQSPAKIGLVKISDTDVALIDSGNDKEAGKRVKRHLSENSWSLSAIYNTHSHADHIGANRYLSAETGCRIYAPGIESAFTRHPILEPAFLYGGYPPSELRHKFLLARESDAQPLTAAVLPDGWQTIPLPGHYFDMVGYRTADNVVYLADCLSSAATLDKYRIGFIYDVAAYLETLGSVKSLAADVFVPSHANPTDNIAPLADLNIACVHSVAEDILRLCQSPTCFETILAKLFSSYSLTMTFEQYALVGTTLRSYLSWLKNTDRLTAHIEDNMLLWTRK